MLRQVRGTDTVIEASVLLDTKPATITAWKEVRSFDGGLWTLVLTLNLQ